MCKDAFNTIAPKIKLCNEDQQQQLPLPPPPQ
jgi:hypothetical protein